MSVALPAGCGDDGASGADSADRSASRGQPQSSPAQVVRATNKKTTQAKTARIKLATTVAAGGNSETITGSGALDLQDGRSRLRLGQNGPLRQAANCPRENGSCAQLGDDVSVDLGIDEDGLIRRQHSG